MKPLKTEEIVKTGLISFLVGVALLGLTSGCKDSNWAQYHSLGTRHKISFYSGGKLIRQWISTGNVSNQKQSDGWYFEDAKTHLLVEVAGQVVIEQIGPGVSITLEDIK